MSSKPGIFIVLCFLSACSLRPGPAGNSGSDVVHPLWADYSPAVWPADTLSCANVVALLIGIGQYNPANGWEKLNARNDIDLMVATLRKRGVRTANIHTLTDQRATKTGIEKALKTLADTLRRGSQLMVLYAGHARQLPDDTGDEIDGYDEAIVPYDAPPANRPQPEGYLRDDDLNHYLTQIRASLGPSGSLWLIFDSCHSQTLNRGQMAQHTRGGIAPMGQPAKVRPQRVGNDTPKPYSDWYEMTSIPDGLAPYVLFAATTDKGPNFETADASGRLLGPLTRAIEEVWVGNASGESYRMLFERVAVAMARFAPYQHPVLDGDADTPTSGCGGATSEGSSFQTTGERVRVAWPRHDAELTRVLTSLPFLQRAGVHPDLRIDRQGGGYRLVAGINSQPLSANDLSIYDCAERIRQYFARTMLLQLQQTNSAFQVQTTMTRVSVQTRNGQTVVTDTLPNLATTSLPAFRASPDERVILTLTNTGPKPYYLSLVDLQPNGTLHVLLPETSHSSANYRLMPGQTLSRRIRMTEPFGAEVYKLLLTPEPIDLWAMLQTRGNSLARHPYEALFQRTYATRGMPNSIPVLLSDKNGATADVAFWVGN